MLLPAASSAPAVLLAGLSATAAETATTPAPDCACELTAGDSLFAVDTMSLVPADRCVGPATRLLCCAVDALHGCCTAALGDSVPANNPSAPAVLRTVLAAFAAFFCRACTTLGTSFTASALDVVDAAAVLGGVVVRLRSFARGMPAFSPPDSNQAMGVLVAVVALAVAAAMGGCFNLLTSLRAQAVAVGAVVTSSCLRCFCFARREAALDVRVVAFDDCPTPRLSPFVWPCRLFCFWRVVVCIVREGCRQLKDTRTG